MAQSLASAAAAEHAALSNSAARAETIRDAVRWLAERQAEVKAINAEINEYRMKHIKGDLGFKLADWNAVYRVSQLEAEDRDELLDCVREGFAALGIGGIVDWVDAAQATGSPSRSVSRPPLMGNSGGEPGSLRQSPASGYAAAANNVARLLGHEDGLSGGHDHAEEYPQGEPGHADYMLGLADGEAERERVLSTEIAEGGGESGASTVNPVPPVTSHSLNGATEPAPRRGRGRPRKRQQEAEADAEF